MVEPSDLYVILSMQKRSIFERHGDDIYLTKEIDFPKAALGGKVKEVPGLRHPLELDIPTGTQTSTVFRIINKGTPHLNGYGRGDAYVITKVVTPTNLSKEEKRLLESSKD